jgi:hypothetical protein
VVRNTQNEDVEDDEEEEKEEKQQPENRIFQRKFVHMNRPFTAPVK